MNSNMALIERAREKYAIPSDDDIEIDDTATISRGYSGAFIHAWVWVPFLAECDDCGETWRVDDLDDIERYHERVSSGSTVPAGECPECGALCYLLEENDG